MNRFPRKHSFSHRKKCSEGSSCLSGHPCTRKCPGGRLTQLLRVTAASDFNWMNHDVWESFLPTQTLGGTILVHLIYYHAALLSLPMDPASGDGRNVLWPGCWSSPAEEREFIAQETNSASREVGSCGGIPLVNGLSSLGEVGIPDPVVQHGRHFFWSPVVKVLLISSLQPSQAHLVVLASLILDLWGEWTCSIHLALFFSIKKFWLFATFLGRDVCKISCLPAVHPTPPTVPNHLLSSFLTSELCPGCLLNIFLGFYLHLGSCCFCLVTQSCSTLSTLSLILHQAPLSMGFSGQEYWIVLPRPSPRDLNGPGIELTPPALAGRFFTTEPWGEQQEKGVNTVPSRLEI